MKTHIIHILPSDDWRRAAARLPRPAGDRALLVWPEADGPRPLEAALRILLRRAQGRDQQLAVASQQLAVRQAAQHLGLPVFTDAEEAGTADWPAAYVDKPHYDERPCPADLRAYASERRQLPQQPRLTARLAWFALGVLAFLLTAALLLGLRA